MNERINETISLWTGVQRRPTPIHTPNPRQMLNKYIKHSFSHISTGADRQTNQRTDKASFRVACPQLKRKREKERKTEGTKSQRARGKFK